MEDLEGSFVRVLKLACDVREGDTFFTGILRSEALFIKFEDELHRLGMKFSVKCRSKKVSPGSTKCKRILFEYKSGNKVPFLGHPFTIEDTLYKNCHLGGRDRASADQQQKALTFNLQKCEVNCGQSSKSRITKKQGCEAVFVVKKLSVYEGIEVERDEDRTSNLNRETALQKVKTGDYGTSCWFCFQITKPEFHNHNFGEATQRCQTIHPLLVERIRELVQDGVRKAENIKNILEEYVRSEILRDSLVKPTATNTSFFPSIKAVRNAVCRAVQSENYRKLDLEVLAERLRQGKDGRVFYRPYANSPGRISEAELDDIPYTETLLVVHQTPWQIAMLKVYGDICILDAVFKTLRYAIPLFFLVVKTNVGYVVAATFVVQFETVPSLVEALQLIRSWCPEWSPRYFLSGASHIERTAAQTVFTESQHFICDFHRERSWLGWLRKSGNVAAGMADDILRSWKKLSACTSSESFEATILEMEFSPVWIASKKAHSYFSEVWMPLVEKWVHFHRPFNLRCCLNINNGAETMNRFLYHSSLVHHANKTVSAMLGFMEDSYLPEQIRSYVLGNIRLLDQDLHGDHLPDWLRNRPRIFNRHVQTRWASASNEFHHIVQDDPDKTNFVVKSSQEDFPEERWCSMPAYRVNLSNPQCTCYDFDKWFYPCKHMCAVLMFVPSISENELPATYLNSPYITLHQNILRELPVELELSESVNGTKSLVADLTCEQGDHSYQQQKQSCVVQDEIPQSAKAAKCREILQEMSSLTNSVQNPAILDRVILGLQPLLRDLSSNTCMTDTSNSLQAKKRESTIHQNTANKRTKVMMRD